MAMDLLDRLLGHDAWTTRQLLLRCENLSDAQLDHEIDIGHKTLRATLTHIVWNMEAWTDFLARRPLRTQPEGLDARSVPALMERLDRAAADFAAIARSVAARGGWDERVREVGGDASAEHSYGGTIAHLITHSMHHRAQVLYMLRRLGVHDLPEGDVLSWEEQATSAR
jgi:uncharacterized damage-inducible protein DinB